jgi:sterol desaturase/sphingolipid hydroxylase (fatty acid hydroxylase superfamily)
MRASFSSHAQAEQRIASFWLRLGSSALRQNGESVSPTIDLHDGTDPAKLWPLRKERMTMWRWLIRVLVVLYLVLSMAACQMTMTAARSIGLETVDWVLGLAVFLICALQWDKIENSRFFKSRSR